MFSYYADKGCEVKTLTEYVESNKRQKEKVD